jgi:hypothetical protein
MHTVSWLNPLGDTRERPKIKPPAIGPDRGPGRDLGSGKVLKRTSASVIFQYSIKYLRMKSTRRQGEIAELGGNQAPEE